MNQLTEDVFYNKIVENILNNEEFNKIKKIEHHGTTRFEHSLKVSYISYKISKLLHLNAVETARAGLLHDFFISKQNRTTKERIKETFIHPTRAVETASEYFDLSDREKNIIASHMFPTYYVIPKYAESWIVILVDKIIGTYEFGVKFKYKLSYTANIFLLLFINSLK